MFVFCFSRIQHSTYFAFKNNRQFSCAAFSLNWAAV